MRRLYAREHDGVAIKTTFDRFKESFCGEQEVCASAVKYVDYQVNPIPFGNGLLPLVHKRISFQHEREARAIFVGHPDRVVVEESEGCYVDVDLSQLILEIVVAPFAQDWFLELVRSLADRFELADRVRASALSETPTFSAQFLIQNTE